MRPAVRNNRHAALLALALALPLALPRLLPAGAEPPRRELYASSSWNVGPFPWIERQIFQEGEPIDVVFAGSSHIWAAMDPLAIEAAIARHRGAPAVVRTLAWTGAGYDAIYFVIKDLLDHRPVKLVVVYDELRESRGVHSAAHRWFRYRDDPEIVASLPAGAGAALYAAAVLGMPRSLYARLNPSGPLDPSPLSKSTYWETKYRADPIAARAGALTAHLGYPYLPTFVPFTPGPPSAAAVVYGAATGSRFAFTDAPAAPYQRTFLERLVRVVREHGGTLVFLDIPELAERANRQITERLSWPSEFPGVRLAGAPPAELFAGLSEEEVQRLYFDDTHFNANGQRYFSAAVTPAIVQLIDEQGGPR